MSEMEKKDAAQAAAAEATAPAPEPEKTETAAQSEKSDKPAKKDKQSKKAKDKKPSFFERLNRWFREMRSELKKVSWPSGKDTMKNVAVVVVCVLVVGVVIGVFDVLVRAVVDALLSLF